MKLDDMFGQEIDELVRLAGITKHTSSDNLTDTASEKANYQKTNDIKPGTE